MRIDPVHISGSVSVIALGLTQVCIHGSNPNGGEAELLNIVQMLADTAKIASMPAARLCPLDCSYCAAFWLSSGRTIVRQISVGKAVSHDQIHCVARRESGEALRRTSLFETVCDACFAICVSRM